MRIPVLLRLACEAMGHSRLKLTPYFNEFAVAKTEGPQLSNGFCQCDDCVLGGRVHPQIAWAKLRALRDGAAIASKKLWS
jgi:hypothetical protein